MLGGPKAHPLHHALIYIQLISDKKTCPIISQQMSMNVSRTTCTIVP